MYNLIRKMIREALGDKRYESGAMTYTADQLIIFSENDSMTYNFALNNPDDKMAIYNYAKARYGRLHPLKVEEDEETVMYDFLAHYESPIDGGNRDIVMQIFGPFYGSQAFFEKTIGDATKVKAKQYALDQRKEYLEKGGYGYSVTSGPDQDGYLTLMINTKSSDKHLQ